MATSSSRNRRNRRNRDFCAHVTGASILNSQSFRRESSRRKLSGLLGSFGSLIDGSLCKLPQLFICIFLFCKRCLKKRQASRGQVLPPKPSGCRSGDFVCSTACAAPTRPASRAGEFLYSSMISSPSSIMPVIAGQFLPRGVSSIIPEDLFQSADLFLRLLLVLLKGICQFFRLGRLSHLGEGDSGFSFPQSRCP